AFLENAANGKTTLVGDIDAESAMSPNEGGGKGKRSKKTDKSKTAAPRHTTPLEFCRSLVRALGSKYAALVSPSLSLSLLRVCGSVGVSEMVVKDLESCLDTALVGYLLEESKKKKEEEKKKKEEAEALEQEKEKEKEEEEQEKTHISKYSTKKKSSKSK
ncbi:hypothetical protein ADUPG1_003447, partial [Aduncisulcus paluster]